MFDRRLGQLRRSRNFPPASPGIEHEVWRRIRQQDAGGAAPFRGERLRGGILLALLIGVLLPWNFRAALSGVDRRVFDARLFSLEAPVLPSTQLRNGSQRE